MRSRGDVIGWNAGGGYDKRVWGIFCSSDFFLPRVAIGRCYRTEEKHDGENVLKKKEWVKCSHAVALIVRRSAPNTEL